MRVCAGLLRVQQEAAIARPGLTIRTDLASPAELRHLARREPRRRTMQRLLAVANALEGMSRADAAPHGRLGLSKQKARAVHPKHDARAAAAFAKGGFAPP
jgi:hypothetical protein